MFYEEDRFHPNNDDDTWIDKLPKKKDLTMFLEPIKNHQENIFILFLTDSGGNAVKRPGKECKKNYIIERFLR